MGQSVTTKIVHQNPRFAVRHDRQESGGKEYFYVSKPNAVLIVPRFRDYFLLLDVTRPHTGSRSLEFVSGRIEGGEEPLDAASRELSEETGLSGTTWTILGIVMPLPSLTTEHVTGLEAKIGSAYSSPPTPHLQNNEDINGSLWVPSDSFLDLCRQGRIGCSVDAYFGLLALLTSKG